MNEESGPEAALKVTTAKQDQGESNTVAEWSRSIQVSLSLTVESIIDTGSLLIDCKASLPHGQFKEALDGAGISPRVAQMYMAIANHPGLSNASAYSHLPPAYNTLAMLARLEPPELAQALDDGIITPKLKVNDATQLANMAKNARARAAAERRDSVVVGLLEAGVAESREEAEEMAAMASILAEQFDIAIEEARAEGNLARANVISKGAKRPSLVSEMRNAVLALNTAVGRIERLSKDSRFASNQTAISHQFKGDVVRMTDALSNLATQMAGG